VPNLEYVREGSGGGSEGSSDTVREGSLQSIGMIQREGNDETKSPYVSYSGSIKSAGDVRSGFWRSSYG